MDVRLNPLFEQGAPAQPRLTNPNQTPRYGRSTSHLNTHRLCSQNKPIWKWCRGAGAARCPAPFPQTGKGGVLEAQRGMPLPVYNLNCMQKSCAQVCASKSLPQAQGLQQNKPET